MDEGVILMKELLKTEKHVQSFPCRIRDYTVSVE